jgi:hypothetical protein
MSKRLGATNEFVPRQSLIRQQKAKFYSFLMCASTAAIGKQPCAAWAFNTGDCGNTLPRGVVMSFYASD